MVLGKEVMHQHDLVLLKVGNDKQQQHRCNDISFIFLQDGYFEGYDTFTNPSASNVFVSAAFRLVD